MSVRVAVVRAADASPYSTGSDRDADHAYSRFEPQGPLALALPSSVISRPSQSSVMPPSTSATAAAVGNQSALPGLLPRVSSNISVRASKMPSGNAVSWLLERFRICSLVNRSKAPGTSTAISLADSSSLVSVDSGSNTLGGNRAIWLLFTPRPVSAVSGSSTPGVTSVSALCPRSSSVTCPSPAKSPGLSDAIPRLERSRIAGSAAKAAASMSAQLATPEASETSASRSSRVRSQMPPIAAGVRPSTFASRNRMRPLPSTAVSRSTLRIVAPFGSVSPSASTVTPSLSRSACATV